jgi:hypothetical protein
MSGSVLQWEKGILGSQTSPRPAVSETALMEAGGGYEGSTLPGVQSSPTPAVDETTLLEAAGKDDE